MSDVMSVDWSQYGLSFLNGPVTYPYVIHSGNYEGLVKYVSGPELPNNGAMVALELESSMMLVDGSWYQLTLDQPNQQYLRYSDDFITKVYHLYNEVETNYPSFEEALDYLRRQDGTPVKPDVEQVVGHVQLVLQMKQLEDDGDGSLKKKEESS
ncbi:hypothetical protein CAAN1_10S05622 [[Candida] anglica]|uniref:Uncharacterized protein n=1 Tax=[Candida] anglica TaxID=148631 RepID=A0ABP0EG50_9ASCO